MLAQNNTTPFVAATDRRTEMLVWQNVTGLMPTQREHVNEKLENNYRSRLFAAPSWRLTTTQKRGVAEKSNEEEIFNS